MNRGFARLTADLIWRYCFVHGGGSFWVQIRAKKAARNPRCRLYAQDMLRGYVTGGAHTLNVLRGALQNLGEGSLTANRFNYRSHGLNAHGLSHGLMTLPKRLQS